MPLSLRHFCGPQARCLLLPSSTSVSSLTSSMTCRAATAFLQWHSPLSSSGSRTLKLVLLTSSKQLIGRVGIPQPGSAPVHDYSPSTSSRKNSMAPHVWPVRLLHFSRDAKSHALHGLLNQVVENFVCSPFANIHGCPKKSRTGSMLHICRSSTVAGKPLLLKAKEEFVTFLRSTFQELEGSNHCWYNMTKANLQDVNKRAAFLVLGGVFLQDSKEGNRHAQMLLFEQAKIIKRRYPELQVFGFQHSSSMFCVSTQSHMIKTILEDYITFPILLSDREFPEITKKRWWLLFGASKDHFLYFGCDTEANVIAEEIRKLLPSPNSGHEDVKETEKLDLEVSMGNHVCSFLKHSVLYFPGCIYADEFSNRIFISDSNHHRIIIASKDGKIVDCIGSVPGFEDGGFETAELLRPAGLFYDVNGDCLYFADSENHAIRRADMERRVVETVYPANGHKTKGFLVWIRDKLGVRNEADREPVALDIDAFAFPWHVMNYGPEELTIFNRSFHSSWVLSTKSGKMKSDCSGLYNILETYGERVKEKLEPLGKVLKNSNLQWDYAESSSGVAPCTNLISSATETNTGVLLCDAASQTVFRSEKTSESVTSIRFSGFEVLGYPYFLSCPIEPFRVSNVHGQCMLDCKKHFKILPGRCEIVAIITIPHGIELAASLQDECILHQIRGSATAASVLETSGSSQQVGVAQQWYDELDNLVYSRPGAEMDAEGEALSSCAKHQTDNSLRIESAVDTSPGTSEVVISAVLYLRLKDVDATLSREQKKQHLVSKLSNLYKLRSNDSSLILLLESVGGLTDLTFMRHVHLRVSLECADHPLDPVSREIISTNSNLELNVSL